MEPHAEEGSIAMSQSSAGAVVFAKHYERLAAFYEGVAGLKVRETDETSTVLESASFQLVILQAPNHIADSIELSDPPARRADTPIKLVFYVESMESAREKAQALGGGLDEQIKEWAFDEHQVCDGVDPEGNVYQLRAPAH
jgi:predicted enzyme related to lactoylglutathione lyase